MIDNIFSVLMKEAFGAVFKSPQLKYNGESVEPEEDITDLSVDGIYDLVSKSVDSISEIEDKVASSMQNAEDAKSDAENAWRKNVGFFNKGEIIENLQRATKKVAHAAADSAETQQLLFKHQCILANVCKKLFAIGITNLATTQNTIRAVEMKLKGASEEEISQLARVELMNVVRQLKAQEDIFNKQQMMADKIKGLNNSINEQSDLLEKTTEIQNAQKDLLTALRVNVDNTANSLGSFNERLEILEKALPQTDAKVYDNESNLAGFVRRLEILERENNHGEKNGICVKSFVISIISLLTAIAAIILSVFFV